MTNETPELRLVTDDSAYTRKPGEPACHDEPAIEDTGLRIALAPEEKESAKDERGSQPRARRNCAECGNEWPEDMLFRTQRGKGKAATEDLLCDFCRRAEGREPAVASGSFGSSYRFDGAGWIAAALVVGIAIILGLTWNYLGKRGTESAEWVTEAWVKKPVDKWPAIALRGSAKMKGTGATLGFGAMLVKKNDGAIVPIALVPASQTDALGIKAANFGDITAQLDPITITATAPGARPLTLAAFPNPAARIESALWLFPPVPAKDLPGTPLEVRRQSITTGMVGHLVATGGTPARQQAHFAHIIQGITDSDEYVLLLDSPIAPELVPGSVFIDAFGHIVGIGEELAPGSNRVIIRNVLTLRGLARQK